MDKVKRVIKVGIADMNIVRAPDKIRTSGLGSCVGVVIYDEQLKLAGLVHIMLPNSSSANSLPVNRAKFADTGIKKLVSLLKKEGAESYRLKAKIAGGSQMFSFNTESDIMKIGLRNVEAVKQELRKLNIRLVGEDVGGNSGRTIEFDPQTCRLHIRTINKGVHEI
ncbi:MAG TPA: chemotaxis protein CheD [Chondromyces sp.]|nr:chemotaxis protein CheD [Chondromyces sp.]